LTLFKLAVKVAVTFAVPETVHVVPLVELHPVQPPKVKFCCGAAVSVTVGVLLKLVSHVPVPGLEQLIPLGELVTTPIPPPAVFTVTSSSPLTKPTQPAQVMMAKSASGSKAFPQPDMDFPSLSRNLDEHRAELVGFQCPERES
jgi:hypothetical protein